MAGQRSWRPAEYWPQTVYVPPKVREHWGFEELDAHGRVKRTRGRGMFGLSHHIIGWMLACGVIAGIVAVFVAIVVLHLV